jgi:SPX domain protein involved in polyphosphate accumulation
MKFGKRLLSTRIVGWDKYYLDYERLKSVLQKLAKSTAIADSTSGTKLARKDVESGTLTQRIGHVVNESDALLPEVASGSGSSGDLDEGFDIRTSVFWSELEHEIRKVDRFYHDRLVEFDKQVSALSANR